MAKKLPAKPAAKRRGRPVTTGTSPMILARAPNREAYEVAAANEGKSLSEWIREKLDAAAKA